MKQDCMALVLNLGTDGAFTRAIMPALLHDLLANWLFLKKYTDDP